MARAINNQVFQLHFNLVSGMNLVLASGTLMTVASRITGARERRRGGGTSLLTKT